MLWSSFGAGAWVLEVEGLFFDWLEEEAKGGKEDATRLNGVFKGGGVEGKAYDCLVVGVELGESGWKGFGLQGIGDLSWGLFKEKLGKLKEGQGKNLLGGGGTGGAI